MIWKNLFISFDSVVELGRILQPLIIGSKSGDPVSLVKNEAKLTCKEKIWSSFFVFLALSSVNCQPINLYYCHRVLLNV